MSFDEVKTLYLQACEGNNLVDFWCAVKNLYEEDFKKLLKCKVGGAINGIARALQIQNYDFILELISYSLKIFSKPITILSTSPDWFGYLVQYSVNFDDFSCERKATNDSPNMIYLLGKHYASFWNFNNSDPDNCTPFLLAIRLNRIIYANQLWQLNQNQRIDCSRSLEPDTKRNALHVFWCSLPENKDVDIFLPFLYEECGMHGWALEQKDVNSKTPLYYQELAIGSKSHPECVAHFFTQEPEKKSDETEKKYLGIKKELLFEYLTQTELGLDFAENLFGTLEQRKEHIKIIYEKLGIGCNLKDDDYEDSTYILLVGTLLASIVAKKEMDFMKKMYKKICNYN